MDMLVKCLEQMLGFKYVIFVLKVFIENFVEIGIKEYFSKVDIGLVNIMIFNNYIDGLCLCMSVQIMVNLNLYLFFKGYYVYGFKDYCFKYMGEVEYFFNKKEYLLCEFLKNFIMFSYQYDVMFFMDKFLKIDKDNVFVFFKIFMVDQMFYVWNIVLKYENEIQFGLKIMVEVKYSIDEFIGGLVYIINDDQKMLVFEIQIMEVFLVFCYVLGEIFVNIK